LKELELGKKALFGSSTEVYRPLSSFFFSFPFFLVCKANSDKLKTVPT